VKRLERLSKRKTKFEDKRKRLKDKPVEIIDQKYSGVIKQINNIKEKISTRNSKVHCSKSYLKRQEKRKEKFNSVNCFLRSVFSSSSFVSKGKYTVSSEILDDELGRLFGFDRKVVTLLDGSKFYLSDLVSVFNEMIKESLLKKDSARCSSIHLRANIFAREVFNFKLSLPNLRKDIDSESDSD